ncbi:cadherin domain-containing protein, partial [Aeromonas sanarellii]
VTYSLSGNPGGLFAIDPATGVVTVAAAIDREALGASVNIEVTATSADGSSKAQTFTIAINDVDEFDVTTPTDTNAATNAVDENIAIGSLVGVTAFASDADATTNAVTYSLSGNPGGLFAIDPATGVVTVAAAIDREALGASVNIEVTATSADGSSKAQTFTIAINDVNDNPVLGPNDSNVASNSVAENAAIGTQVGITASASDADAGGQAITYSLSNDADGRFTINSSTGVVTVAAALDYETATNHSITVRATSADGSSNSTSFTIGVTDVGEPPTTTADSVITSIALGTAILIPEWSLLLNDSSNGDGLLDVTNVGSASDGTVSHSAGLGSSGSVSFIDSTPAGGSFSYAATDGTLTGAAATVSILRDGLGSLDGTEGNEILIGSNSASETLVGGQGNDVLLGGSSNGDIYRFGLADGSDIVRDSGGNNDALLINTSSPTDSTALSALHVERVGSHLLLDISDTHITVQDQFAGAQVETLTFSNGGTIHGYTLGTAAYTLVADNGTPLDGSNGDNDLIASSSGAETLNGLNKNDLLFGNSGTDILNGGGGNDLLLAGGDNDVLSGGDGNDVLGGGAGADRFVFAQTGVSHLDSIIDYNFSEGDSIDLSDLLDANFTAGSQESDFVRLTQSGNSVTVQVDTNGASGGANFVDAASLANYGTSGSDVVKLLFEGSDHLLSI